MSWFDDFINLISSSKSTPLPITANNLIDAINDQRTKFGLPSLISEAILMNLAQDWAEVMARNGKIDHGDFSGRIKHAIPAFKNAGENIAAGQTTIAQVIQSWMNSPPHRANILGNFNSIGVGIAKGSMIFWCLDFDLVN